MAKGSLDSVRLKIARAEKHLHDAEILLSGMSQGDCSVVSEQQLNGSTLFRLKISPVPPIELSLIAGDFLCNVRAALDHLVYQLTILNGKTNNSTLFPICDVPADFLSEETRKKLTGVIPRQRAVIEKLQPYGARNPLKLLAVLNNADKHRVIALTPVVARDTQITLRDGIGFPWRWEWLEDSEFRDGDFVTSIACDSNSEMKMHTQASVLIAFDNPWIRTQDGGKLRKFEVYPSMRDMLKFVKETVIPRFVPLFT